MPGIKTKIALIATGIQFTNYSIVYKVSIEGQFSFYDTKGIVVADNSIKDKDLILKPTFLDAENMEVIFTPSNPTPHFYQRLMLKTLKDNDEYADGLDNIYAVGDVVGHIVF